MFLEVKPGRSGKALLIPGKHHSGKEKRTCKNPEAGIIANKYVRKIKEFNMAGKHKWRRGGRGDQFGEVGHQLPDLVGFCNHAKEFRYNHRLEVTGGLSADE